MEAGGAGHRRRPGRPHRVHPDRYPGRGHGGRVRHDVLQERGWQDGRRLKSALHTIISSQTKLSYDAVWDALKVTDQDPANSDNVILLYSGVSRSKTRNGGDVGDWNREHVWAKSHGDFGTATGPGTDLHHLRPRTSQVNSIRGNKDFDNGGSAVSGARGSLTDSDSFEPRDAVKGDVARMILYMAVRYEGGDGFADLEPNDKVNNGSDPYIGKLSVLQAVERRRTRRTPSRSSRNQVIYDSTSTTATRSSTTRSGSRRSGSDYSRLNSLLHKGSSVRPTEHRPSTSGGPARRARPAVPRTRAAGPQQPPEVLPVAGHLDMCQFVGDDVVDQVHGQLEERPPKAHQPLVARPPPARPVQPQRSPRSRTSSSGSATPIRAAHG